MLNRRLQFLRWIHGNALQSVVQAIFGISLCDSVFAQVCGIAREKVSTRISWMSPKWFILTFLHVVFWVYPVQRALCMELRDCALLHFIYFVFRTSLTNPIFYCIAFLFRLNFFDSTTDDSTNMRRIQKNEISGKQAMTMKNLANKKKTM